MKAYSFFFHYNKPASKAQGKSVLTVHFRGQCHLVHGLTCEVLTHTRINAKKQPHCVIAGKCNNVIIENYGDRIYAYIR